MTLTQITSPLDFRLGWEFRTVTTESINITNFQKWVTLDMVYSGFSQKGFDFILNLN